MWFTSNADLSLNISPDACKQLIVSTIGCYFFISR